MSKKQPHRRDEPTRLPAERTIAVAIVNPTVAGAKVEVQVDGDPNLWLRGTSNDDGYCSWMWSDSLGDSVLEITADGYKFYQQSIHWKTFTDPNVGPPPLNQQLTVGGDLPPMEPLPPPTPQPTPTPAEEDGPLHVERPTIRDVNGDCWQWRGFTDFLLFYRFLCGVDLAPFLTERIALGANILRVFSMVGWAECSPRFYPQDFPDYYASLAAFADLLGDYGLRFELTIFADAQIVMPDAEERKAHVRDCLDWLRPKWNKVVEISNEPFKNLPGGSTEAIQLAQMACEYDPTCLIASGEYESWPPAPTAVYGTTHCDRSEDWPRKCKDLMDRCDNSGKTPWIGDEPMGCADEAQPGKRDNNPDNFAWYAAGCQMFGPGGTFHTESGIHSRTPLSATETACAQAFFWALQWMPTDALLMPYQRGDMGSEAGIGNMPILHDDALESRSYCKGNGTQEWCVQIQTTREHATARDGWRIVSEPRRGFVYLEKP